MINQSLQHEIVKLKLKEMLKQKHFNICALDDILKYTGGIPPKGTYDTLRALHCIDYCDMSPALRIEVAQMIKLVVESQPLYVEIAGQIISGGQIENGNNKTKMIQN